MSDRKWMNDEAPLACGRQACNNPADPRGWNAITGLMYCASCMAEIRQSGDDLFPLYEATLRGAVGRHGWAVAVRRHQALALDAAPDRLNTIGREVYELQQQLWPDTTTLVQGLVLAEEAGEVCRVLAKSSQGIRETTRGDLADELADVVIVALGLAAREGVDIDQAVAAKLERIRKRGSRRVEQGGDDV